MASIYVLAGINHFRRPRMYERIIPPWLPAPRVLNRLAGLAEIGLGLALFYPPLRTWAAWGVVALLVAVFPANLHMAAPMGPRLGMPRWLLLTRLPLQVLLMLWAYVYTQP